MRRAVGCNPCDILGFPPRREGGGKALAGCVRRAGRAVGRDGESAGDEKGPATGREGWPLTAVLW